MLSEECVPFVLDVLGPAWNNIEESSSVSSLPKISHRFPTLENALRRVDEHRLYLNLAVRKEGSSNSHCDQNAYVQLLKTSHTANQAVNEIGDGNDSGVQR